MSLIQFRKRVRTHSMHEPDRLWFPKWLGNYAGFHGRQEDDMLPVETEALVAFLRQLLERHVYAWQRLQAARAVELYRNLVIRSIEPSYVEILAKLSQIAAQEKATGCRNGIVSADSSEKAEKSRKTSQRYGEGTAGRLDPNEPEVIRRVRSELRLRHYRRNTEKAYAGWVRRFIRFVDDPELENYGVPEIREFLTELALVGAVDAGTQNQALSAMLFLYEKVFQRELAFIDAIRAKESNYLPVVLTRSEIEQLMPHFQGRDRLFFWLLYGAGLRHREGRRLRVKDICLETRQITVRNGKGEKDRVTVLPNLACELVEAQLAHAKRTHQADLDEGFGESLLAVCAGT